jgi:S-adenosylmethionine:tRNA ribosyltransferase-isomerase
MKRLMVIDRKKQTIEHKTFKDVDYFDDGDVLILILKFFPHVYTEIKKKQEQESKFFYLES